MRSMSEGEQGWVLLPFTLGFSLVDVSVLVFCVCLCVYGCPVCLSMCLHMYFVFVSVCMNVCILSKIRVFLKYFCTMHVLINYFLSFID